MKTLKDWACKYGHIEVLKLIASTLENDTKSNPKLIRIKHLINSRTVRNLFLFIFHIGVFRFQLSCSLFQLVIRYYESYWLLFPVMIKLSHFTFLYFFGLLNLTVFYTVKMFSK